ncbi:MAG: hypothetical protein HYU66_03235 [Armatimonadetes bacterium]|nr:hypothetical protein [Armatimonadota bacterium]
MKAHWVPVLLCVVAGLAAAQEEQAPQQVLDLANKALQAIREQKIESLAPVLITEGLDEFFNVMQLGRGPRADGIGEEGLLYLYGFILLYNPPGAKVTWGQTVVEGDRQTRPFRKQWEEPFTLLIRPRGATWGLDLLGSGFATVGVPRDAVTTAPVEPDAAADNYLAVLRNGDLRLTAFVWRDLDNLLTPESKTFAEQVALAHTQGLRGRMFLSYSTAVFLAPDAPRELRPASRSGDGWRVPFVIKLDVPMKLVLQKVGDAWKVDLLNSARASAGLPLPPVIPPLAAQSMANLTKLAEAARAYAAAHGGKLPDPAAWTTQLQPYYQDTKLLGLGQRATAYAMNRTVAGVSLTGEQADPPPGHGGDVLFFETENGQANASGGAELLPPVGWHAGQVAEVTLAGRAWLVDRDRLAQQLTQTPPPDPPEAKAALADAKADLTLLTACLLDYAKAHDGRLPEAAGWSDELLKLAEDDKDAFRTAGSQAGCSYAFNRALSGVKVAGLVHPERTVVLFQSKLGTWNATGAANDLADDAWLNGRVTASFANGSVARIPAAELRTLLGGLF